MKAKPKKPIHKKSKYQTLLGRLGYLNSYYCPVCGKHLFSAYDKDLQKDRKDGFCFYVSSDFKESHQELPDSLESWDELAHI